MDILRIGGASGFWGEAGHATAQLLQVDGLDVLVYDYLAEITMSIMARARLKDASRGYAVDFVTDVMAQNLAQIAEKGVKVLSNAGGVNPVACAEALRERVAAAGLSLKIAVVEGDDILDRIEDFAGAREMFSGADFPPRDRIASANAYLGAFPVAAALAAGADIVITGRCVDSALTLGAAIHRFGWQADAFDKLAAGSLAGHLLECGPQATGGNFTDWRASGDLARIGYPVAEITGDGTVTITKPQGTGGVVSVASVGEQMLYEIGDPCAYVLPDVVCDFSAVTLTRTAPDRVRATGARGRAPTGKLKVSVTWFDGYRAGYMFQFNGLEAREKAEAFAAMGLSRARAKLQTLGAPDFRAVSVEFFGGRPGAGDYEEIALKAAVHHDDARAVGLFLKELIGAALAAPPGLHGFTGAGRPRPSPVVALFSFLMQAEALKPLITLDGDPVPFIAPQMATGPTPPMMAPEPPAPSREVREMVARPLIDLAWARSGDKGNAANIGVIARNPAYLPWIWAALTPQVVAEAFAPYLDGAVERFSVPGIHAMNLLLHDVLGGGGMASLRNDPQGKGFAQILLTLPVPVPADLIANREEGLD